MDVINSNHNATRAEMLLRDGAIIVSPATSSMLPFIRPQQDQAVFELPHGKLCKYAVALYCRESQKDLVMHRVLSVAKSGYYLRGDNYRSSYVEFVPENRVVGIMIGYYRDDNYYSCNSIRYKVSSRLWLEVFRPAMLYYRNSHFIFWRGLRCLRRWCYRCFGR